MNRLRHRRPRLRDLSAILTITVGLCSPVAGSQGDRSGPVTVVILRDSPPFSYQGHDGMWMGLAVEMWQRVATELHLETRFEGSDRQGLMDAVASGQARFGVGPLSITADRLGRVDFSIPIYATGVAVAVPHVARSHVGVLVNAVLSLTFLKLVGGLLVVAVVVGTIFWMAERHANPAFGGRKVHGWGVGIWLSVVTMTTVGYGDTAPRTLTGRVVAAAWMFASIVLISIFTGTVATLLTLERLGPRIGGFDDLSRARVAAVTASASAQFLEARQVPAQQFPDPEQALRAVLDGRADSLVFDRTLLASTLKQHPELPLTILPGVARLEYYAFALRPDEPLRRQINSVIARTLDTAAWRRLRFEYFGNHAERD